MSLKHQSQAAQEFAAQLIRSGKYDHAWIAQRLNCTLQDVLEFAEFLKSAVQKQEEAEQALPPLHSAFLDACKLYNDMGEKLKQCSEAVSGALQPDELADLIDANWHASKGMTIGERVAHLLYSSQHIVLSPPPSTNVQSNDAQVLPETAEPAVCGAGPDADPGD